jgi:GNAT superfamily N-acetyltransferase
MTRNVEIRRWSDVRFDPYRARALADINAVFFLSSTRQTFDNEEQKAAFRETWLGRYLEHFPDLAFIALDGNGRIVGYVIGSLEDPARDPLFADLELFSHFRDLTPRYPAQLHVNLAPGWRGRGVGADLVNAFSDLARSRGAPGVHVVTARGMRNVRFYLAQGFLERGALALNGRELLFLGRDL